MPICPAANACIHGTRAALLWELANGVEIRGDPQSAPTGRTLRFPPKPYGFHQTRIKPCQNAKINGKVLCHYTQWVRDPTMNSIDLPFETLIKPCVSEVRHLGNQCRRGCSGIPSYGFHKKILRFPPNPQKSLSKCKSPHNLHAPIDQAAGRDRQPGAPRHVRT